MANAGRAAGPGGQEGLRLSARATVARSAWSGTSKGLYEMGSTGVHPVRLGALEGS